MEMTSVSGTDSGITGRKTLVWDVPTRVFHWLVVALVAAAWITGEAVEEGSAGARWHFLGGYVLAGALVFRLGWGLIGGAYARFSSFVRSPAVVAAYTGKLARGAPPRSIGHNPLGGWMVLALLGTLVVMVVSGLFGGEEGEAMGPLAHAAPWVDGKTWAELHESAFNWLLALIGLHVLGVLIDRVLTGDRLVKAMITGRKMIDDGAAVLPNASVATHRTVVMLVAAAVVSLALASLPGSTPVTSTSASSDSTGTSATDDDASEAHDDD
jgi:cytochrome b